VAWQRRALGDSPPALAPASQFGHYAYVPAAAIWARRIAFAAAACCAAAGVAIAFMPFTDSGGFVAQTDEGARGVLLSHASCSAPIVEAWHGRDERWVIPIGDNIGSDPPQMSGTVTTCRGEARRRLQYRQG
jgi:hypothetical protein